MQKTNSLRYRMAAELREAMRASGHCNRSIAVARGVSDGCMSQQLSGRMNLSCDVIEQIANVIGCEVEIIIKRKAGCE